MLEPLLSPAGSEADLTESEHDMGSHHLGGGVPGEGESESECDHHAHTHEEHDETVSTIEPLFPQTEPPDTVADPAEWKKKMAAGGVFFLALTIFFVVLAIVSRNVDPERYSTPRCAECDVVGSTASNVAQGLLPFVYLGALGTSWWIESPRRTLRQFAVDNMKQVVSGAITHFEATAFAVLMYDNAYDKEISECDWYLILFMLDTAYGCFLTIAFHAWTVRLAAKSAWFEPLSRLGDYYGKPGPNGEREPSTSQQMTKIWLAQTAHWTVVAIVMRGLVVGWAYLFRLSVGRSAVLLGSWACDQEQQNAKTFLNIIFFPIIFDAIQVSVQSFALKPSLRDLPVDSFAKKDRLPPPIADGISVTSYA